MIISAGGARDRFHELMRRVVLDDQVVEITQYDSVSGRNPVVAVLISKDRYDEMVRSIEDKAY